MKYFLSHFITLALITVTIPCLGQWSIFGEKQISGCNNGGPGQLVVTDIGDIFRADTRCQNQQRELGVFQYRKGVWQPIHQGLNLPGKIWDFDMSADSKGILYIALREGSWDEQSTVYKWDGLSWSLVGPYKFGRQNYYHNDHEIAFDSLDNPYLIVQEVIIGSIHQDLVVYKWENSQWIIKAREKFNGFQVGRVSAEFSNQNELIITTAFDSGDKLIVWKYSDALNDIVGIKDFSTISTNNAVGLAKDKNGKIYMGAWFESPHRFDFYVYDGSNFILDKTLSKFNSIMKDAFLFDDQNNLVVMRNESLNLTLEYWNGVGFDTYTLDWDTKYDSYSGSMDMLPNGEIICYTNSHSSNKGTIIKFDLNSVGINKWDSELEKRVYPNPFNSELNVDFSGYSHIQIFNSTGALKFESKDGSTNKINSTEWQNGIYYIVLSSANNEKTDSYKVIKAD